MGGAFDFYLDFYLVTGNKGNDIHANVREDIPIKRVIGMYATMNSYFLAMSYPKINYFPLHVHNNIKFFS